MDGSKIESSTLLKIEQNCSFGSKIIHCLKWDRGNPENHTNL